MAHSMLAGLAKAVASDMAANGLSRATQLALRRLEDTPECTFDLVELIAREGRKKRPNSDLMGAYAFLLMHTLESLRYGVERNDAGSIALAERLRATLVDQGETGRIGAPMLLLVLNQFAAAKLDIGDALRTLMARAMATDIDTLTLWGPARTPPVPRTSPGCSNTTRLPSTPIWTRAPKHSPRMCGQSSSSDSWAKRSPRCAKQPWASFSTNRARYAPSWQSRSSLPLRTVSSARPC